MDIFAGLTASVTSIIIAFLAGMVIASVLNKVGKAIVFIIAVVLLLAFLGISSWLSSTLASWTGGLLAIIW